MRRAFTMLELVFVIVVLGILAGIAIPKMMATRTDAQVAKARSTVAAVRSGIVNERQMRLFRGDNTWVTQLDDVTDYNVSDKTIFDGNVTNPILMYGVRTSTDEGHWVKSAVNTYAYKGFADTDVIFTYDYGDGSFDCNDSTGDADQDDLCRDLTR